MVDLQCASLCCTAEWLGYAHIYMVFTIPFLYGLSPDVEDSSLCYTVGLCCSSILNVIVCIYQPQTPSQSLDLPSSFLATTSMFSMSVCLSLFCACSFVPYFRFPRCCSVSTLCLTLCNSMDCSTPGFSVPHHLPAFAQLHVHWISDATYKWYDSTYKWYHMIFIFLFLTCFT